MMNCDDLLMNFVIANATNRGPVAVDDWRAVLRTGKWKKIGNDINTAQWKQGNHVAKRDRCLNKFVKIYGRMPLMYTSTVFRQAPTNGKFPAITKNDPVVSYEYSELVPHRQAMR
jgi:hypothetical protein